MRMLRLRRPTLIFHAQHNCMSDMCLKDCKVSFVIKVVEPANQVIMSSHMLHMFGDCNHVTRECSGVVRHCM